MPAHVYGLVDRDAVLSQLLAHFPEVLDLKHHGGSAARRNRAFARIGQGHPDPIHVELGPAVAITKFDIETQDILVKIDRLVHIVDHVVRA